MGAHRDREEMVSEAERVSGIDPAAEPPRVAGADADTAQPQQAEESCPPDEAAPAEDPVALLKAELDEERRLREAAQDQALRWRADLENLRRRTAIELEQARANSLRELIEGFLPVLDDFDLALASAGGETPPAWLAGMEMVRRKFLAALAEHGLARMQVEGETFDPAKHEAMMRVEDSGRPANTIVEEIRPGYTLGAMVIRPALVKVQV
ncbi:MAG: nucleotide exchange factor GrpE [Patescibacteria group bacterium]